MKSVVKFEHGGEGVLDEVGAYLAKVNSLAQAADCIFRVGKDRAISVLDDELIEKAKAARAGIEVSFTARAVCNRQRGCEAFEVDRGGVAGRAGLVVVDEAAGLVLLVTQEPVCDLERHVGEVLLAGHLIPLAERLQ